MTLDAGGVTGYLVARGVVPSDSELTVEVLGGGVSGTVLAVHGPGIALVVKQALPKLLVDDAWFAPARRTDTEAAALRLAARLLPGRVPPVIDSDDRQHVLVMQHAPAGWRNWQAEMLAGRVHAETGTWAGDTLGRLHAATAGDAEVAEAFGDYAPKNILLGSDGTWLLDAEVAHVGHPVFDLAFFLAFALLTAVERPELAASCSLLTERFTTAYARRAGELAPSAPAVAKHTGAMLLARTDGRSPAAFLSPAARERARALGRRLLLEPAPALSEVVASCG